MSVQGSGTARRLRAPSWKSGRPVFTPASASYLLCDLSLATQPLCASSVKWEELFTYPMGVGRIEESCSHTALSARRSPPEVAAVVVRSLPLPELSPPPTQGNQRASRSASHLLPATLADSSAPPGPCLMLVPQLGRLFLVHPTESYPPLNVVLLKLLPAPLGGIGPSSLCAQGSLFSPWWWPSPCGGNCLCPHASRPPCLPLRPSAPGGQDASHP